MKMLTFQLLPDELWYGGSVIYALMQPFDKMSKVTLDMDESGANQSAPLFLSTKGRYVWADAQALCLRAARLHNAFADTIISCVRNAMETGEPIVRMMEYAYPHRGYARIRDQFMLGEDVHVCPVIQKGMQFRSVVLPKGKWRYCDGSIYEGESTVEVSAPLDVLPYFMKVDA